MFRHFASFCLLILFSVPARADQIDDLVAALRLPDVIAVMRQEGLTQGEDLAADMLGGVTPGWQSELAMLYDADRMEHEMRRGLEQALGETQTAPLVAFLESDEGQQIVALEIAAREAMVAPEVEAMARDHHATLRIEDNPRLAQIDRYIAANDLIDSNVSGALNASLQFYTGLVDGGALRLTQSEILDDVRASAPEVHRDISDWVPAFLLMAYQPLAEDSLERYIELSQTDAGAALNTALFAAFNGMYDDISYRLGRAIARELRTEDL